MKIDNFALTMWQTCPAKFDLGINNHWQPRVKSAALSYGTVIHEGLAEWYRGEMAGQSNSTKLDRAVQKIREVFPQDLPVDDFRNLSKAIELMTKYAAEYPGENFQILDVEIAFTLDLGLRLDCQMCLNGETGNVYPTEYKPPIDNGKGYCQRCNKELETIEYGGIIDAITQFGPVQYVLEHKTTSELGPLFFRQFETSNQITGYCWALNELSGKLPAGANVNALCTTKGGNIKFARESTGRNEKDFERWKKMVQSECNSIAQHKATGIWPYRTEQCHGRYGLCTYHSVHTLSTPIEMQRRLDSDYVQRPWDYELRDTGAGSG